MNLNRKKGIENTAFIVKFTNVNHKLNHDNFQYFWAFMGTKITQ
jgi:hypothetical protein